MRKRIWICWQVESCWSIAKDKVLKMLYIDLGRISIDIDYGK